MSKENVHKFYVYAQENEAVKAKILEALNSGNIVELAKEQGFEFTKEENDEYLSGTEEPMGELGDDQLDGIAGGIGGRPPLNIPQICKKCGQRYYKEPNCWYRNGLCWECSNK